MSQAWYIPFPQERAFWDGFDADYLFEFADRLSRIGSYELGFRSSGSPAGQRAGYLILEEMQRLGLANVRKEPFPVYAWDFAGASLTLSGQAPVPACSYPPTPGTLPAGLSAPLVNAGCGTAPDYLGLDVQDKIAFVRFDTQRLSWVDMLAYEAELHGACALVFYYLNGYAQHESGQALNTHDGQARPTIPILQIPRRDGERITQRLAAEGPLPATLHSQVKSDPAGTGYNIVGQIPGRQAERYLIVGAHYDAWFHGYWDNAVGVAGLLAMARTLLEHGYRPEHTLLFIATDAEEFGAPDTHFDWLIGCYRLLEAHPEWGGRVSAAFNIDTLAFVTQEQLGFIGPPELLPFVREAVTGNQPRAFPQPDVCVQEQVTAWTEVLTYAYFGIPALQPRFALDAARQTIYHTQFDTAQVVHRERAVETLQLYGALLVRLDQQPILPYEFSERVRSLRASSVSCPDQRAAQALAALRQALDELERSAQGLRPWLAHAQETEPAPRLDAINDRLRQAAAYLVAHTNYLDGSLPEDARPLHTFYDRDLRALDAALAYLAAGDAKRASAALTDQQTGLHGAGSARDISYPVYHRHTVGAQSAGRPDLFWGKNRTATISDVWIELFTLQDKLARGIADFGAEADALRHKREALSVAYRDAINNLAAVVKKATAMLPGK